MSLAKEEDFSYLDKSGMLRTIHSMIKQINYVTNDFQWLNFPNLSNKFNKIVVVGMGSSLIAFRIIYSIYKNIIKVPILIVNDFVLPSWIDEKTLIVLSSYSGNSKEVISCAKQIQKKTPFIVITSGGNLKKITENKSSFTYLINKDRYNYCQLPRMALGFSLAAFLLVLLKLKIISLKMSIVSRELKKLEKKLVSKKFNDKNYLIAKIIKNHLVDIISTNFLEGNAQLFSKQLNWNSKIQAYTNFIPEAMHHLLEGLNFPENKKQRLFIFLYSDKFSKEEKNDLKIIKKYLRIKQINSLTISSNEKSHLMEAIELMLSTFLISFYLSVEMKVNPVSTPAINFYKSFQ